MAKLIRMKREGQSPCFADVHPDEIDSFRKGGFEVVDHPLDHDGNGEPGGSVAGFHATAAKGARKRKAK